MLTEQSYIQKTSDSNNIYGNDDILMTQVLKPYKDHSKYLKSADVVQVSNAQNKELVVGECKFAIPKSCYNIGSSSFNPVEFNIAYNQMMYYVIAKSVKEKMMVPFLGWTIDDFWKKQLPDIYIVNFESNFRRSMLAEQFYGEIEFTNMRLRAGLIYILTKCRYWDGKGGHCDGEVKLAIVN